LLVEVSVGIGLSDVTRAIERAGLLARLGRPVVPVVAGREITTEALHAAQDVGVRYVLNGRANTTAA
jgi:hypothetical protein